MAAKRIIPTPAGLPLVGTTLSVLAAGGPSKLHLYVNRRHQELGPIYKEKLGPITAVFLSDPDHMRKVFTSEGKHPRHLLPDSWLLYNETYQSKRGLLFMDGEEWSKLRRTLNPLILKPQPKKLYEAISIVASDLVERWPKEGGRVDELEQQLYRWSNEVILSVLLGGDQYKVHKDRLSVHVAQLSGVVHDIFIESAKLSMLPATVAKRFNLPVWRRFVRSVDTAVKIGNGVVDEMLTIPSSGILRQIQDAGVSRQDLYRTVTDLILAAGDTTSLTAQWMLYLLSKNMETQEELRKQVLSLTDEEAVDCGLLKGALREALRLYPVAPFVTRYMPADVEIGGYVVKEGELVILSLYSSGRDQQHFPNPDKFQPHRWLRDRHGYLGVKNSFASLPFAMGPRSCIGKKIAQTQVLITFSKILKKYRVSTKQNIDMKLQLITVPSKPIQLDLTPL